HRHAVLESHLNEIPNPRRPTRATSTTEAPTRANPSAASTYLESQLGPSALLQISACHATSRAPHPDELPTQSLTLSQTHLHPSRARRSLRLAQPQSIVREWPAPGLPSHVLFLLPDSRAHRERHSLF